MEANSLQGILTRHGVRRIAGFTAGEGEKIEFVTAAVGDGGGEIPPADDERAELVREVWRGAVNSVQLNPQDPNDIIIDLVIPNEVGGFVIREWGLFDEEGALVAVGPHAEMYKPEIGTGQTAEFIQRFHLKVSNVAAITLVISSAALATQEFVEQGLAENSEADREFASTALAAHAADGAAHGAAVPPEPSSIALRDTDGRVKSAPALAGEDALTLDYYLCWYVFKGLHPTAKPGMVPVNGTLLANADELYPKAFAYLQTPAGQQLCITQAAYDTMRAAAPWNGIGGAPKFVLDAAAKTIRVPDLRGMYDEVAGYDGLGVGEARGDQMREITGRFTTRNTAGAGSWLSDGVFEVQALAAYITGATGGDISPGNYMFRASRVVPTGPSFAPMRWGALACVYLGLPS